MLQVIIVDDQRLFAESLKTLIQVYADDVQVVGLASNGAEAISLAEKLQPDVILMDVRMPGIDGVQATKKILEKNSNIKIMMLSTFNEDEYVNEALHYGASGYLLKDISPIELITSIRAINEGSVQISPSIASKLVDKIYDQKEDMEASIIWYETLSPKEKRIFKLIAKGYSNKQIAEDLFIGEQTVRNYVSSIYSKLEIRDRFKIIQLANKLDSQKKM